MKQRLINRCVALVLRSPLHRFASGALMLITYTGVKTQASHTLPVMYVEYQGAVWVMVGWPERKRWWRNITTDTPVVLRLCGRDVPAAATRCTEDLLGVLEAYLARFPRAVTSLGLERLEDGSLDPVAVADLAQRSVFVRCVSGT